MDIECEQRVNIKFCVQLGKTPSETWTMIKQAYGREALSRSRVFEWHKRFREGRDSVQDDPRAGRPSTAHTDANVERVRQLLQEDRHVTVRAISEELNLNRDVCHKILREDLGKRKLCPSTIRCSSSSCEMDTKIEIKEDDPLSDDTASQNERECFTKSVTVRTNSDAVPLYNDCNVAIKTEIKSETLFPDLCSPKERECLYKHPVNLIKSETALCSINFEIIAKTETGSQNDKTYLPESSVVKFNKFSSDHEMGNKVEIKEEPWWLEREISSVCGDIKDGDLTPVKSPRLCMEAVSDNGSGDSPLPSAETSGENTSLTYGKNCQVFESKESVVAQIAAAEKHIDSEQSGKCNDVMEICRNLIFKGKKSHICQICKKIFTQSSALKLHNLIHEGKKPHKCKICEKRFTRLSDMKSHNFMHEGEKPHKCDICEKRFLRLSYLKIHNLIHEGKKPHKCDICDRRFTQLSALKSHILIHEGKKPHKCKTCDKRFTRLSDLKSHNLIHEGKKPYRCEVCEKRFTRLSDMKSHNFMHEGKKPHKCEICEKSFIRLSHLKIHNLIHEGKKPHKCEICDKKFTQLSSLKLHYMIHEGKKPHKCEICDKRFTKLPSLKLHYLTHEGKKPHKCEICEKSFIHVSSLKLHNFIHESKISHQCEVCEKRFTRLSALKSHNLIHEGKKPHKCEICDKSFTQLSYLKLHSLIHEGKKPHNCEKCQKGFTRLSALKKHNLKHEGQKQM